MQLETMAERRGSANVKQTEFTFTNVQLFKNETLGTGSYGAVCRAKCDQLSCAAKLLYPVLFQMLAPDSSREHRQPFHRFEQECQFLSSINHPNIVQYLGTYQDSETNAPVLLMELMDESLTHFLESSPGDVPYHTQVNFSQDVAQAIAFLHTNGIIHRDLSSNNVLLIAKSRAKVTDFGMSKLVGQDTAHLATLTICPGTPVFMAPEALEEPPMYTEKLDTFSFGVLLIQVMTRQFPRPTERFATRSLFDPNFPNRIVKAQVPIPEVERRQAHICTIEKTHPLLPLALSCLQNEHEERPSSRELCCSLYDLKRTPRYEESLGQRDQLQKANKEEIQDRVVELEAEIRQLTDKLSQATHLIHSLRQNKLDAQSKAEAKEEEVKMFNKQLEFHKESNTALRQTIATRDKQLSELKEHLLDAQSKADATEEEIKTFSKQLEFHKKSNTALRQKIATRDQQLTELKEHLLRKDKEIQDLSHYLSQAMTHNGRHQRAQSTSNKPVELTWRTQQDAPTNIIGGSSTVIGDIAYFKPEGGNTVYRFDSRVKQWLSTLFHPMSNFSILNVRNELTTVGGMVDYHNLSNKLFTCVQDYTRWVERFPPMKIARSSPTAVYTNETIITAGGNNYTYSADVEVLRFDTMTWTCVSPLLFPMCSPSLAVRNDCIYIHAGHVLANYKHETHSVLKCSLPKLLQSKPNAEVWERSPPLPEQQSTLVAIGDRLIAVGGEVADRDFTSKVFQLDEKMNSWQVVSQMSVARHLCLTAQLPGDLLMVVGGDHWGESVEQATIQ